MNRDTGWVTDSWVELALIGILTFSIPVCVSAFIPLFTELAAGGISTSAYIVLGTSITWTAFLSGILTSFYVRAVKRNVSRIRTE